MYGFFLCQEAFYHVFGEADGSAQFFHSQHLFKHRKPLEKLYDRAYHTVFQVEGRIYKSFMKNRLQCALDFTALGNRRKLTRQIGENKVTYKYTSPVQHIGATLTWHFSGGKKMRKVEAIDGIQDYKEIKDFR